MWPYRTIVVREEVVILKNRPTGGEASCVVSDSTCHDAPKTKYPKHEPTTQST